MTTNESSNSRQALHSTYLFGFFLGRPAQMWREGIANSRRRGPKRPAR